MFGRIGLVCCKHDRSFFVRVVYRVAYVDVGTIRHLGYSGVQIDYIAWCLCSV